MIKECKSNRTRQVQFRMDPDKVKRLLAAIAYDDNMHSIKIILNILLNILIGLKPM